MMVLVLLMLRLLALEHTNSNALLSCKRVMSRTAVVLIVCIQVGKVAAKRTLRTYIANE